MLQAQAAAPEEGVILLMRGLLALVLLAILPVVVEVLFIPLALAILVPLFQALQVLVGAVGVQLFIKILLLEVHRVLPRAQGARVLSSLCSQGQQHDL